MHVLFIYGPPASGKLTIARIVADQTGFALFHNHLIVDALLAVFPFASPEFVRLREEFWLKTIAAAAHTRRSMVFTFCPETTVEQSFPDRVAATVEQEGGTLTFIRLEVGKNDQEQRLVSPSRIGGKLRRVDILRSFSEDFEAALSAMPPAAVTIDTSKISADDAARQILAGVELP